MALPRNIQEQREMNHFLNIHPDATGLFDMKLWEATYGQYTRIVPHNSYRSIFSDLHTILKIDEGKSHNCLACNLTQSLVILGNYLVELKEREKNQNTPVNLYSSYSTFILLLHLQTEKIFTLFQFIGITRRYQKDNWKILTMINLWANFVKHPKGFLFCHHPVMVINKTQIEKMGFDLKDDKLVHLTYKFIKDHYRREDENVFYNSINLVKGKPYVFLEVTSPIYIMEEFALFCEELMEILTNNPFFRKQLTEFTSIKDYWKIFKE